MPRSAVPPAALAYLLLVLSVATIWGRTPAMAASVLATVCFDFLILPPPFSFAAADPQNLVAVAAFLLTAITAGNLSERSKRLAAAYSRDLIEACLDPLAAIGLDGRITDANAAMEHMTGYARASLIGSDFASYFTDPDKARIGYERVFRDGFVRNYALDLRHRDGHTASVLYSAAVFRDSGGQVRGAVAEARDITEWKRAEDQFHHLAQLQAETAELAQHALRRSPLTDLLNDATVRVARGLGVEYCNIAEMLPDGEALLLRAGVGWDNGLVGSTTVERPGSQSGYAILSPAPVIVEDTAAETRFVPLTKALGAPAASAISVAITSAEGPYGSLGAHSRERRTFTPDEVNFLQTAANVVGMAIEREHGEERLRRINRAHGALSMTNQALVRITDKSALLQQICKVIIEEAEYRLCWVGYAERDAARSVRVVAQAGFDEGYLKAANITWADSVRGRGPTGTCIRTGKTQIVKSIAGDPMLAPWRSEAEQRGYASSIAIPLLSEGVPFGALTIYSSEIAAFVDEEVQLLTELAEDLGYGIVTLRMQAARKAAEAEAAARERETAIGFRIQQMLLLDEPPTGIRNLRVAAQSIPSQRVAGDFYQFFTHRDESVDIIVADVMGKGVPAALLGAATKSRFIEALCHLMTLSPSGVLPEPRDIVTLADSDMAQHLIDLESFVTLCYARVDPGQQRLDLVDCGHTGLIHLRGQAGECAIVHGDNLPLGVRAGEVFNQIGVHIETGDIVLFYSDGITEASSETGELFGTERLMDCVRRNATVGPEALVAAILAAVAAFAGSDRLTDDRTCVAIAIGPQGLALSCQEIEIGSDLRDLRRARAFVRSFCGSFAGSWLDRNGIAELELAVSEAASNVMRHAYQGRTDQRIQIEAEAFADHVALRLHHLGDPFDPAAAPPPALDGSRDFGFGIYLITHSVDEFRYYRDERGGSCVALVKKRKG